MLKRGFSTKKYLLIQENKVLERIRKFDRLYLEFGGKLFYDNHAARILPGYKKTIKAEFLKQLEDLEIIYCINAKDLQATRRVGGRVSYEKQALKDLRDSKKFKIEIKKVIITRYDGEAKAKTFRKRLIKLGKKVYFHKEIPGYPNNLTKVIRGYAKQPYIPIKKDIVVVTGPTGGSGKMAVALSQIYHDHKKKINSGFAKFETFPIWNLPLKHPINLAYEAATADLQDKNMIDPYHWKAYKVKAVNYNRDIENFAILKAIIKKITKKNFPFGYKSPTDMGINTIKQAIINPELCKKAALKEIKRRYKIYQREFKKGRESKATLDRVEEIIKKIK